MSEHKHIENIVVTIVDFYGDPDTLLIGEVGSMAHIQQDEGGPWRTVPVLEKARDVAQHHVREQAQSVVIGKRLCCLHGETTPLEVVK